MNTHDLENPQDTTEEGHEENVPDVPVSETDEQTTEVESLSAPKAHISVESDGVESDDMEPDDDEATSNFPPGHLDVASKVREPNKQEKIVGTILDEFEKIDDVAGETGFKLEAAIAKEEILQGDDTDESPSAEDTTSDKPLWKTEAERRYEAQQARKQRMLEDHRRLEEERRQKQDAYKARLKADREVYEADLLQKKADEKARLIAEREAADARLRAEREAKLRARELYEAQQRGHIIDDDYSPETIGSTQTPSDDDAPVVEIPVQQVVPPEEPPQVEPPQVEPPQVEPPQAKPPSAREREAVNRLGKPPSDDESDDEGDE